MEHKGQGAPDDPHLWPRLQEGVYLQRSSSEGRVEFSFHAEGLGVGATFPGGDCTLMVRVSARRVGWKIDLAQGEGPPG